jgi:hypothetical protein
MRALAAAALLLLAAAPLAEANHPQAFPHVNPLRLSLQPDPPQVIDMEFEGGSFEEGWVFLLNGFVQPGSAPAVIELRKGNASALGEAVHTFRFTETTTQQLTTRIPAQGVYALSAHSEGPGASNLTFFYDQSCNCAGKPIPYEVPQGLVVFNVDLKQGQRLYALIPEPSALTLNVTLHTLGNPRAQWPDDFPLVARSSTARVTDEGARILEFNLIAMQDGRYYFFAEAARADPSKIDPANPAASLFITPYYEQGPAPGPPAKTPWPAALGILALGGAACWGRPRGR